MFSVLFNDEPKRFRYCGSRILDSNHVMTLLFESRFQRGSHVVVVVVVVVIIVPVVLPSY